MDDEKRDEELDEKLSKKEKEIKKKLRLQLLTIVATALSGGGGLVFLNGQVEENNAIDEKELRLVYEFLDERISNCEEASGLRSMTLEDFITAKHVRDKFGIPEAPSALPHPYVELGPEEVEHFAIMDEREKEPPAPEPLSPKVKKKRSLEFNQIQRVAKSFEFETLE